MAEFGIHIIMVICHYHQQLTDNSSETMEDNTISLNSLSVTVCCHNNHLGPPSHQVSSKQFFLVIIVRIVEGRLIVHSRPTMNLKN